MSEAPEFDWDSFNELANRMRESEEEALTGGIVMGKKYDDYTVTDLKSNVAFLIKSKYCPLPDASEADNVVEIKATIKYIETMGEMLQIPVANVRLLPNFNHNGRLLNDRAEINKRLVEIKNSYTTPDWKKKSLVSFTEVIGSKSAETIREGIEKKRIADRRQIEEYQAYIESAADRIRASYIEFGDTESVVGRIKEKLDATIEAIADNDFYELIGISNKGIYLLTKPVGLRYDNPAQGLDVTRDMGQLTIFIPFGGTSIRVKRGLNNYSDTRYLHPHVGGDGQICWGNVANQVTDLLLNSDYHTLLNIIQDLLCTYNYESPYLALQSYSEKGDRHSSTGVEAMLAVTQTEVEAFETLNPDYTVPVVRDLATDEEARQKIIDSIQNTHHRNGIKLKMKSGLHYMTEMRHRVQDCVGYSYTQDDRYTPYDEDGNRVSNDSINDYVLKIRCISASNTEDSGYDWNTDGTFYAVWEQLYLEENLLASHPLYITGGLR